MTEESEKLDELSMLLEGVMALRRAETLIDDTKAAEAQAEALIAIAHFLVVLLDRINKEKP